MRTVYILLNVYAIGEYGVAIVFENAGAQITVTFKTLQILHSQKCSI